MHSLYIFSIFLLDKLFLFTSQSMNSRMDVQERSLQQGTPFRDIFSYVYIQVYMMHGLINKFRLIVFTMDCLPLPLIGAPLIVPQVFVMLLIVISSMPDVKDIQITITAHYRSRTISVALIDEDVSRNYDVCRLDH